MENDPSYSVIESFDVNGNQVRIHNATKEMLFHAKIEAQFRYGAWFKILGPFIDEILLVSLSVLMYLNSAIDLQINTAQWLMMFFCSVSLYVYLSYYFIKEEQMICVKDLGIQVLTVYMNGRMVEEFIPQRMIADVVINEVIYMQRFIYVLVILTGKAGVMNAYQETGYSEIEKAITLFKGTKPRLHVLRDILGETRNILFAENDVQEETQNFKNS